MTDRAGLAAAHPAALTTSGPRRADRRRGTSVMLPATPFRELCFDNTVRPSCSSRCKKYPSNVQGWLVLGKFEEAAKAMEEIASRKQDRASRSILAFPFFGGHHVTTMHARGWCFW